MDQEKIQEFRDQQAQSAKEADDKKAAQDNAKAVADTVKTSSLLGAKASSEVKQAVKASGDKVASEVEKVQSVLEAGQDSVAQAINNLMLATVLTKDPRLAEAADNVAKLLSSISDAGDKFGKSNLNLLPVANKELAKTISELAKSVREKEDADLTPQFDKVVEALNNLDIQPIVNVPKSDVRLDVSPITDAIKELQKSIKPAKIDIPKVDFADVIKGLKDVQQSIGNLSFPVPNYVLPFKDVNGRAVQVQLDSSGNVPTTATITTGDIEIGAVEIKDGVSDNRQTVDSSGAASFNQTKIAGTAVDTNSGVKSAGTMRVVLATDQPALTNKLLVTPDSVALPANQSVNVSQINGVATTMGNGASGTGVQRVTIASDSTGQIIALGNVASAASDSGNPVKVGGKYNATPPTFTDGQRGDLQVDSRGNTRTVDGAFEVATMFNAILNDVDIPVKASAGYLKSIRVSNINAAIRYLQIHNKTTAPAGGDTPILSFPIPAGSATVPQSVSFGQDDWGPGGLSCSTGISIGISTVAATFTAATTTDHVTTGTYV